jgi:hypothetical protein
VTGAALARALYLRGQRGDTEPFTPSDQNR